MESKVHIALRLDRKGSVDSEDINILQDGIELLHRLISFSAVSILGTWIVDELMHPEARWSG